MTIFQAALVTGVLVGILTGIVGSLVVLRQRAFFTVALTHATFPGGVLAALLGVHIAIGAGVVGVGLVALMLALGRLRRAGRSVAAGIVLAFGYALGMVLHSLVPSLQTRAETLLTGSIVGISTTSILLIAGMLVIALVAVAWLWKDLLYSTVDRGGFAATGGNETRVETVTLALIVGTVATCMPAIGSILAIAMVAAPAAAARLVVTRMRWMLPLACAFGVGSAVLGLYVSVWFSIATGGAMAICACVVFMLSFTVRALRRREYFRH